jgi:hypothetical protein
MDFFKRVAESTNNGAHEIMDLASSVLDKTLKAGNAIAQWADATGKKLVDNAADLALPGVGGAATANRTVEKCIESRI